MDGQENQQATGVEESGGDKFKFSRRGFLIGGAAVAGVAVLAACGPKATTTTPPVTTTTVPGGSTEFYTFLNMDEASTLKAICAQIIPGSAGDPGAAEAGAHIYIDRALSGAYTSQQRTYRRGLASMDAYSMSKYSNVFGKLTFAQQTQVLTDMQTGTATGFSAPAAPAFFALLVQHVREGTFSDPVYGGNRNLAGWKMVGFPGAQVTYGEPDLAVGADQSKKQILTMADSESIAMPSPQSGF